MTGQSNSQVTVLQAPLANVESQLRVPACETEAANVIAPVAALTDAVDANVAPVPGTSSETSEVWPPGGPPIVWKKEVGQGFSNPSVAQGRLILFHRVGDKEVVEALDAATGKAIWPFPGWK